MRLKSGIVMTSRVVRVRDTIKGMLIPEEEVGAQTGLACVTLVEIACEAGPANSIVMSGLAM